MFDSYTVQVVLVELVKTILDAANSLKFSDFIRYFAVKEFYEGDNHSGRASMALTFTSKISDLDLVLEQRRSPSANWRRCPRPPRIWAFT